MLKSGEKSSKQVTFCIYLSHFKQKTALPLFHLERMKTNKINDTKPSGSLVLIWTGPRTKPWKLSFRAFLFQKHSCWYFSALRLCFTYFYCV